MKKPKALIKKLGLMPPNKLSPEKLAQMFDTSTVSREFIGMQTVGGHNCMMGITRIPTLKPTLKVAVVGKGITFDSGGISIKPGTNMHQMKFDMLGAATSLALSKSISPAKSVSYIFLGCCAENLPNNPSFRPGDVIKYPNGTKVEIINTDAEGRLVLADGILKAKEWGADIIITIATLTGAAKAALGEGTAVFGNKDLVGEYLKYAEQHNELAWELPIWDIHRNNIKHKHKKVADILNCGTIAGASTAAAFLEHFIGNVKWLHLDIAGSAYKDDMPTGVAYGPLKDLIENLSEGDS